MTEENKKPKRASLLRGTPVDDVDLQMALALLALPREVGLHPESGQPITAAIGRFGPYIAHDKKFISLKGDDDVLSIGLTRAVTLIAEAAEKGGGQGLLRELGDHPTSGEPVTLNRGRFGPYVKCGKINATIPGDAEMDSVTLEPAIALIEARAAKAPAKKAPAKKAAKAKTAKKPAAKKPAAKKKAKPKAKTAKTAAKKPAAKKTKAAEEATAE